MAAFASFSADVVFERSAITIDARITLASTSPGANRTICEIDMLKLCSVFGYLQQVLESCLGVQLP